MRQTRDWLQAIESVIREEGVERAQYLIDQLLSEARKGGVKVASGAGLHLKPLSRRLCVLQKAADQSDTERAQHLLHG